MDFLNDRNTYFVDSKHCPMAEKAALIFDPTKSFWEDIVSVEEAAATLRCVYDDYLNDKLKSEKSELVSYKRDVVMNLYNDIIQNS